MGLPASGWVQQVVIHPYTIGMVGGHVDDFQVITGVPIT
jgi:hypothetical protein